MKTGHVSHGGGWWRGWSGGCWEEGVGTVLRDEKKKRMKIGNCRLFKGEPSLASLSCMSTEITSNTNIKAGNTEFLTDTLA